MSRFCAGLCIAVLFFPLMLYAQPEKIVVGGGQFRPMFIKSETGRPAGRDVDLWRLWSIKTGIKVEFRIMDWAAVIPALLNGEIDVAAGASFTPERAKQMAFTEPYQKLLSYLFYHEDSPYISNISSLSGHAVGVLQGTHIEEYMRFNVPDATLVPFRDYEELVAGALKGHVKVFIAEEPLVSYHFALAGGGDTFRRSTKIVIDSSLRMAVRLEDTELLNLVNQGFARITPNERYQIDQGWFGTSSRGDSLWDREYHWFFLLLGIGVALTVIVSLSRTWFQELADLQSVREKFINMWFVFAAIAALPLGLISVMRAIDFGWNHLLTAHVIIVLFVIAIALFRKWIHYYIRTALVLALLYIVGIGGLLAYGLVGPTTLPLVSLVLATIILFGMKGGIVSIFATLAALGGVGLAVQTGLLQYSLDMSAYANSLPAWANTFVLYAFYTIGLGLGTGAVYKHMEDALLAQRKSEAMFRGLVETSSDWIWETDGLGNFVYSSPQVRTILGYTPEEVLGRKYYSFMPPDKRQQFADMFRAVARESEMITALENTNLHKDGHPVVLESSGVPVHDAGGNLTGYRGIARDITERKKAEEERERLILAIEQAGEAIIITDASFAIQYVNPAFEQITGYTRSEVVGTSFHELDKRSHENTHKLLLAEIRQNKRWSGRISNTRKDGTPFTSETSVSPVRDTRGKVVNYIAVQRDITNEIRLEEQLRQSQKMEAVGQLAGGVAHDFNNLLQAIMGYGDLAREEVDDEKAVLSSLEEIMGASQRAITLVRQLLAFSRHQVLEMTAVNLNELVANLMKMICRVIGEHIALDVHGQDGLGFIRADRGQIEQILMNLCVNARDAMPDGGTITIVTRKVDVDETYHETHGWDKPGRYILLSISDTGCGMDEETVSKAFEPFFTTKPVDKGTGLGLAMVYGLVKQHGGFVHLQSEVGKGTTFEIYLPEVEPADVAPAAKVKKTVRGGTETLLIAEDDEMVRRLTQTILERSGYTVLAATDGAEAVRLFNEHADKISLVVLDVIMPKLSGLAACERVRQVKPGMPALLTSGYSIDTVHTNVIFNDTTKMLHKPYHPDDLLLKIREILDRCKS